MIYIQSNSERNLPHHFDAACALYGAMDEGNSYRLTTYEEVASGKFDTLIKTNLFVGSTEFMQMVFSRAGKENVGVPFNSNRVEEIQTLGEAKKRIKSGEKLFLKPVQIKLFTGFVHDGFDYSCIRDLPDSTEVIVSDPFKSKIRSEWRIYVSSLSIKDSHLYSGDFRATPDYTAIEHLIDSNFVIGFPTCYTIDVGILENGNQVVIEYNDMWAIGNYGVPNSDYLRMLKNRYFQIMNS